MLIDKNINLFQKVFNSIRDIFDNSNCGQDRLLLDVRRLMSHQSFDFLIKLSAHFFCRNLSNSSKAKNNVEVVGRAVQILLNRVSDHHQKLCRFAHQLGDSQIAYSFLSEVI